MHQFELIFHFGSYLSQILMDFASIWVILKLTGQADRANPAIIVSCDTYSIGKSIKGWFKG